jgi:hypothetical protein
VFNKTGVDLIGKSNFKIFVLLKDPFFRKYFIRFLLSVLLLQLSFFAEQRYLKNTPKQYNDTYLRLKDKIKEKELLLVKTYQKLLADTLNYEKNWLTVNEMSATENLIIQVFKNDTMVTWTSNLINVQKNYPKLKEGISYVVHHNGSYLMYHKVCGSFQFLIFYNVFEGYSYKNQYLSSKFNDELAFLNNAIISPQPLKGFADIKDMADGKLVIAENFKLVETRTFSQPKKMIRKPTRK